MIKDIHSNGMELTNQVSMADLKPMSGLVERLTKN